MRKRYVTIMSIMLMLLALFLVASPTAANSGVEEKQNYSDQSTAKTFIPVNTAKIAVSNFIDRSNHLPNLKDSKLILKHKLYNNDDSLAAYYFEAKKNGEHTGYFIVSASKLVDPILQYSQGGSLEELFKPKNAEEKTYYFGLNRFYFAKNADDLKVKFKAVKNKALKKMRAQGVEGNSEEYNKVSSQQLINLKKSDSSLGNWSRLLKPYSLQNPQKESSSVNATVMSDIYEVLNVDRIWQRRSGINHPDSACGPTVGAMIADYYHDVMHYAVRDNAQYGSWANLVDHLYGEMNSSITGTYLDGWELGMYWHVTHDSSAWVKHQDTTPEISDITSAINSNDPLGLQTDYYGLISGTLHAWHWYSGIGYDYNFGDWEIAYKDPDGGENNNATHWFDWSVNDQDLDIAWMR